MATLEQVSLYPAVPMGLQKVADVERAQMLIESPSRKHLHRVLSRLQDVLHTLRSDSTHKGLIRWLVDVDPQAI
jgi:primosomal protein N' (replication factor Y)